MPNFSFSGQRRNKNTQWTVGQPLNIVSIFIHNFYYVTFRGDIEYLYLNNQDKEQHNQGKNTKSRPEISWFVRARSTLIH